MSDKHYCLYSKIVAVLACAGMYLLTDSLWSLLFICLAASYESKKTDDNSDTL